MREVYCFLLGFVAGVTLLTTTSYRRVSPTWLKWSLVTSGMLLVAHYLTLALLMFPTLPHHLWALRFLWHLMPMALLFPGIMAIDQLVRHPAISPKTLLKWLTPFLVADGLILWLAPVTFIQDPVFGWIPSISVTPEPVFWTSPVAKKAWVWMLSLFVHEALLVTALATCLLLIRKPLPRLMRQALGGLAVGFIALGITMALLTVGERQPIPFLLSELLMLLALWCAYEAAAEL